MRTLFVVAALAGATLVPAQARAQGATVRQVFIDRVRIPEATLTQLEAAGAPRVPDGRYWYDRVSGA